MAPTGNNPNSFYGASEPIIPVDFLKRDVKFHNPNKWLKNWEPPVEFAKKKQPPVKGCSGFRKFL